MSSKELVYRSILLQLESRLREFISTSLSLLEAVHATGQITERHQQTFEIIAAQLKKLETQSQEVKEKIAQLEKESTP